MTTAFLCLSEKALRDRENLEKKNSKKSASKSRARGYPSYSLRAQRLITTLEESEMSIRYLTRAALATALMATASHAALAQSSDDVEVPDGHSVALETVGVGTIKYMCETNDAGEVAWVFKGPSAALNDGDDNQVGSYYGPPATWEAMDGSRVTGTEVATADNGEGNIPLQLVEANPAEGEGEMSGVTYIQRMNTQGGVAPESTCDADHEGATAIVTYQADYNFYMAE